ncbi:hypothetical protein ADL27_48355 [Streptomyces sp. NRRL F-6602]|nr:hypothetical protein ADL27_48355 [Streptomyces sp. NRRL F-6602]
MALRIFGERLVRRADHLEDCSRSALMTYGHRQEAGTAGFPESAPYDRMVAWCAPPLRPIAAVPNMIVAAVRPLPERHQLGRARRRNDPPSERAD